MKLSDDFNEFDYVNDDEILNVITPLQRYETPYFKKTSGNNSSL